MAFDFNDVPLRMSGLFPVIPQPLEVSIYGFCHMACQYCFANLNREAAGRLDNLNAKNSTPALFRKIKREMDNEHSAIGYFLREKYPIVFSNTTDPFQLAEQTHRSTEAFLQWAHAENIPVYVQTRGNVLMREFERYAPLLVGGRNMVYFSICQDDDKVRKKYEPNAMSIELRWELMRMLSDRGIACVAACNPYTPSWVADPDAYCELAKNAGAVGVIVDHLHFTNKQADNLKRQYKHMTEIAEMPLPFQLSLYRKWHKACAERGLDFSPSPITDARMGHVARYPSCINPAHLGGKILTFNHNVSAVATDVMRAENRPVVVQWDDVQYALECNGVQNAYMKTSDFWYAYNAVQKADYRLFQSALGDVNTLYEIIRYFYNHPYDNGSVVWYNPYAQSAYYPDRKLYAADSNGDLLAVFNPARRPTDPPYFDAAQLESAVSLSMRPEN